MAMATHSAASLHALAVPDAAHPQLPAEQREPLTDARRPAIHEIRCRTVLNRVRPPMPFRWSANPYRGCYHACAYCYARPSHATYGLESTDEFDRIIFVKSNAPEVLRAE